VDVLAPDKQVIPHERTVVVISQPFVVLCWLTHDRLFHHASLHGCVLPVKEWLIEEVYLVLGHLYVSDVPEL
jgi:hypothetical protein